MGYGAAAFCRDARSRRGFVLAEVVSRPGRRKSRQVTVPDGWHPRVELAGLVEQILDTLVIAVGTGGLGVQDQAAGGNLLPVLLPQVGPEGI